MTPYHAFAPHPHVRYPLVSRQWYCIICHMCDELDVPHGLCGGGTVVFAMLIVLPILDVHGTNEN